jgi:hypothetical protein
LILLTDTYFSDCEKLNSQSSTWKRPGLWPKASFKISKEGRGGILFRAYTEYIKFNKSLWNADHDAGHKSKLFLLFLFACGQESVVFSVIIGDI